MKKKASSHEITGGAQPPANTVLLKTDAAGVVTGRVEYVAPRVASGIPVHCAFWGLEDVADLRPNPQNPKKHPRRQLELYAKIIQATGWRRPIVVSSRSRLIVKGHGAFEAARDVLKVAQVPVDVQHYDSEEAELADLLADNKLAEHAEYDEAALTELLGQLTDGNVDLELAGILSDLADEAPATLKALDVPPAPPAMTWVLIGIPTVRFGEINALVERAARLPEVQMETTFGDAGEAAPGDEKEAG